MVKLEAWKYQQFPTKPYTFTFQAPSRHGFVRLRLIIPAAVLLSIRPPPYLSRHVPSSCPVLGTQVAHRKHVQVMAAGNPPMQKRDKKGLASKLPRMAPRLVRWRECS